MSNFITDWTPLPYQVDNTESPPVQFTALTNKMWNQLMDDLSALRDAADIQVDNLTALAALDTQPYPDWATAYVEDKADVYTLYPASPVVTPDGINVVAAFPPRAWVSYLYGRWDDLSNVPTTGPASTALTIELYKATTWYCPFFRNDSERIYSYQYQMPHAWDGSPVFPHVHVVPAADPPVGPPQIANFSLRWMWLQVGETIFVNSANWNSRSVTLSIVNGDVDKQRILSLGTMDPPTFNPSTDSAILLFSLTRNAPDGYIASKTGGGTAAANLAVLSSDIHYRKGKNGSLDPFPVI
jgi:hypothetical protein